MKIIKTSLIIANTTVLIFISNAFCMSPATGSEFSALATQRMLPSLSPQIYRTFGTVPSTSTPETQPLESSFTRQIQQQRTLRAPVRSFVPASSLRPSIFPRLQSPFFNQPSRGFASFEAGFSYDPKKLGTALDNLSKLLNKHFKTSAIKLTKNSTWRDILHMSQKDVTSTTAENKKKILQNIKLRYFELSKIVHTDQNKTPEAATQFVILQEAHENGIKAVEKNTLVPMSFNPPASQYSSQTSSSSSQSQQRSSASQAKSDWQTQQEQRERAAYEKAAREAAEQERRQREEWARRQQQSSSQSRQQQQSSSWSSSNTDSRTNNSQKQQFWQSRAQAEEQLIRLIAALAIIFGTGRLVFLTGRFAATHKGKIAAAIIIYKMYKKHRESSARELYKQQRALMDQLEVDDYWHTHELTDKALVEIARKNFAKQFIDTYLDGKYNKESMEKFYNNEGIRLNALDEQWMKNKLSKVDARYSRILDQLDTLQKARDEMFNRKTTLSIKEVLNKNIHKEIAEGLKDYVSQNKLGWF